MSEQAAGELHVVTLGGVAEHGAEMSEQKRSPLARGAHRVGGDERGGGVLHGLHGKRETGDNSGKL